MQHLYRVFDEEHRLLYVGISNRWHERMHAHEKDSEWFGLAKTIKLERFNTREEVEAAEKRVIRTERPLHNKTFNAAFESKMDHFQKLKFYTHTFDVPVDEVHKNLVEQMREEYAWLDVKGNRKASKYLAWIFVHVYMWLDSNDGFDCRNCQALFNDKQVSGWVALADEEMSLGEES